MEGDKEHISKAEYEGILGKMQKDLNRSERERQVERAHGMDLPSLLKTLHRKHDGNLSKVLREMNQRIEGSNVSRPTLYSWADKYGLRDEDE